MSASHPSSEQCHVCGEHVSKPDQAAHFAAKHPGPHVFHHDAVEYHTDKPSMTVHELKQIVRCNPTYSFCEERNGEHMHFSDGQAVDLTRDPWFYSIPPATF